MLLPVQISPQLCPLGDLHFTSIRGEGESIVRAPHTSPSSSSFTIYFLNSCQRNAESSCRLFGPQEQFLAALAPRSILRSYLGSAAASSSFCQDARPTMHLLFNLSPSPSLRVLCLSLPLSTLQLQRGRKTFQLLAKSNTKSLS